MLSFVLEAIAVSILVSIFATWIKLIPCYPKKKYNLIQQLVNTALLTVFLTLVSIFGVYPSWILLFAVILLILWMSIRLTNNIVKKAGGSAAKQSNIETNEEEPKSH